MAGTLVRGALLAFVIFGPMLLEARRASANERHQRARGGVQPRGDVAVYAAMQVLYPLSFAAMIGEGAVRGWSSRSWFEAGLICFLVAKAVKWWAIAALGTFWTFRVVVVPGAALVTRGPYRFLRHPNYVGVVGELAGTAMMAGAPVSGPAAIVLFGILLKRRISVEEEALVSSARYPPCSL